MRHRQRRRFTFCAACLSIAALGVSASVVLTESRRPSSREVRGGLRPEASLIRLKSTLHEPALKFADKEAAEESPLKVIGGNGQTLKKAPGVQSMEELAEWELKSEFTISIPGISVEAPVYVPSRRYWDERDWGLLEQQMQVGMRYGSVAYPHTALPGRRGTIFVAGHSSPPSPEAAASRFGELFRKVPDLNEGDEIVLKRGDAVVTYQVRDKTVVPPTAISILTPQRQQSILKLITCFPVGTTKDRMIVTAVRV